VIAQFLIDKDGSIKDVKIVRGVHPSLDKESIRVIESMPRWTPGKVKGEPVKTKFTLPVAFKI
jgi:protein TonB